MVPLLLDLQAHQAHQHTSKSPSKLREAEEVNNQQEAESTIEQQQQARGSRVGGLASLLKPR